MSQATISREKEPNTELIGGPGDGERMTSHNYHVVYVDTHGRKTTYLCTSKKTADGMTIAMPLFPTSRQAKA